MTAFTVSLLLIVWLLARRDAQQREERRRPCRRTSAAGGAGRGTHRGLSELSNYLQDVREDEKSKLARDIHDELGGILVSAKMDVAWVADHVKARDPEAAAKLERALQALDDGVQIKRRIIEELRPTLLDNLGPGGRARLAGSRDLRPRRIAMHDRDAAHDDRPIPPSIAIALYRIVQEALTNIVKYARAKNVTVDLSVADDT